MTGIFIAVFLAGKSIGVLGPLPPSLDIDQCRQFAGEITLAEPAKSYGVRLVCSVGVPK